MRIADYQMRRRRLWLAFKQRNLTKVLALMSRNSRGIVIEEWAYAISDRAAVIVIACAIVFAAMESMAIYR